MNLCRTILVAIFLLSFFSCNQEPTKTKSDKIKIENTRKSEQKQAKSDVKVPDFENENVQKLAEEYNVFMNKALAMYDDYKPGSKESRIKNKEYIKESKEYKKEIQKVLDSASSKDVYAFQDFILAKQEENQLAAEKMVAEMGEE